MHIALVGADFEENLGVGMIAAALVAASHGVRVLPFGSAGDGDEVVAAVLARAPDVIGLSIQFQHRVGEFLGLARRLRAAGYQGHITCGGQFPTLAWREILTSDAGLDSIVLGDGERTVVELVDAFAAGRPLDEVAGLALLGADGVPVRTRARPLDDHLDALLFPLRYRPHARHVGVPFIPILGGRGCWGACHFCSISAFGRVARQTAGGGRTFRLRGVDSLAAEMALLWHRAEGAAIFCFHDDNFLLPRPDATLTRLRALRAALDGHGVGKIALVGKCRPETLTPGLARELAALGVIRLYVGVENASVAGGDHLGRAVQTPHAEAAINACNQAGINACYNLLVFEPHATLDDLRTNIAFIRAHPEDPVNFCRAEPYVGTSLHAALGAAGRLDGDHLAWGYRIDDDRVELAFRIAAAVFRQRNFDPAGVANRYMGLQYSARILERFYDERDGVRAGLAGRCAQLTRQISLETAGFLDEVVRLADAALGDDERVERETARLGLRILRADQVWQEAMDHVYRALEEFAAGAPARPPVSPRARRLAERARHAAVGASLALSLATCRGRDVHTVDPVPPPNPTSHVGPDHNLPVAPPPPVCDPPPPDPDYRKRSGAARAVDARKQHDTGATHTEAARKHRAHRSTRFHDPPPPDPPPPPPDHRVLPTPVCDPLPPDPRFPLDEAAPREPVAGHFRETTTGFLRTDDLPLWAPPVVHLEATPEVGGLRVHLVGAPAASSTRWEGDGVIEGSGRTVLWRPEHGPGFLRVAVRARGGVAFATLNFHA